MDKKQRFVIQALVPQLLGTALYNTICYFIKKDITEMRGSIKVQPFGEVDFETLMKIKVHAFQQVMETPKFRDMVLHSLNKIKSGKTDIIAELLVQYELSQGPQSTLMHDALSKEFDKDIEFLKESVKGYKYEFIYSRNREEIPTVQ